MSLEFGKKVYEEALKLKEEGKDANQIAKILCDRDPEGSNYGIGIILTGEGKPMESSATLLDYSAEELKNSATGTYMNSSKILEDVKTATLQWQRIPEKYWGQFKIALPSDAGTGALKTGIEIGLMLNPDLHTLGIEELGWPAYKAIAKSARVQCKEFSLDGVISGAGVMPIYQAGPMNTTGLVRGKDIIESRAASAAQNNSYVVLDRAYPGFEFARKIRSSTYDDIMRMSYELQLQPYIDAGVTFALAISPTKAFVTFALRPCGLLLIYCPDKAKEKEATAMLNTTMRARGSSFEHSITRAFAKAMVEECARLEEEHKGALIRLAEAEILWHKLVKGTPIEYLYSENYAGLFRNPEARDDAPVHIYNEHIYPVFSENRCRQNITGIPSNEELAQKHVSVFAAQCF